MYFSQYLSRHTAFNWVSNFDPDFYCPRSPFSCAAVTARSSIGNFASRNHTGAPFSSRVTDCKFDTLIGGASVLHVLVN